MINTIFTPIGLPGFENFWNTMYFLFQAFTIVPAYDAFEGVDELDLEATQREM